MPSSARHCCPRALHPFPTRRSSDLLSARQLLLGAPLTFVAYLVGTVLPTMIFIQCVLVPRFQRLTGSTATTVILGGVAYTLVHCFDRSEEHTSELQSLRHLVCRLLLVTAAPALSTLSLHDALPICSPRGSCCSVRRSRSWRTSSVPCCRP